MEFHVVIPARYHSSRLPGKVLLDIHGKPMVQHIYERACTSGAESVVIATDDEKVKKVAEAFGAPVYMTSVEHRSGTERISEVVVGLGFEADEVVVNVQGDMPFIDPEFIKQVAANLIKSENRKMATLGTPLQNSEDIFNPHIVKMILSKRNYALYFSRAPIPWQQGSFPLDTQILLEKGLYYRHIGLYAYRVEFLEQYALWEPSPLEAAESLEQLRALWHGARIHVQIVDQEVPVEVNTPADLEVARQ